MKIFNRTKTVLYTVTAILIAAILLILGIKDNLETTADTAADKITDITGVSAEIIDCEEAPLGFAKEFRFILPDIEHDTNLMFHTSHSYVTVYVDDVQIYSIKTSSEIASVKTPSGLYNVIHACNEGSGKEIRVVVMPVYESFLDQNVTFSLGNVREMMLLQIKDSLAEVTVTTLATVIGLLFVVFGIYLKIKTKNLMDIVSLGMFSLSIGLWRFFDFSFLSLFLIDKTVFVYYISLTMLMISMIPFLESVKKEFSLKKQKLFDISAVCIAITSILQLTLQLFGVFSLREMLKVTHITIIASILLTTICLIIRLVRPQENEKRRFSFSFILILGIALDMLMYYFRYSSAALMFTIISILIYVIGEGIRLVVNQVEKEDKLLSHEIKLAQNEAELSQARFTTMMSQIRSHFIFNILNAISGMCKYDPEKADRTIVHFARFLRSNIDIMQNDELVHFHNALRHIEDYIALEQVRYGDDIQFETDIQIDDFLLPPLVMQPLVENAIIHGLVPKKDGGTITLRTRRDKENIYIIIEDNGVGYDNKTNVSHKSIGMQNIRFRLEHMVNGTLKTESILGLGTKSTIIIPQKEAEK